MRGNNTTMNMVMKHLSEKHKNEFVKLTFAVTSVFENQLANWVSKI